MDELSKYLADQIAFFDEELTAEELAESAADRESLLESIEKFYHGTNQTMFTIYGVLREHAHKLPHDAMKAVAESVAWQLDDCLSRFMVLEVPKMVSRALRLEPLLVDQSARVDQNPYLREATRCYMFGLFNASVALSRSALELALSQKIPTVLQGKSREDRLQTLIRTARTSILKRAPQICDLADQTRKTANPIIHGKACQESEALAILQDTRRVLRVLYSPPQS
ncbi:MAG TPA: hypothetical protein VMU43_12100 [Candidatus Acidoferrum sp.]|nr:hypothetical protein [Candidatus Acidoferrum sp.]